MSKHYHYYSIDYRTDNMVVRNAAVWCDGCHPGLNAVEWRLLKLFGEYQAPDGTWYFISEE